MSFISELECLNLDTFKLCEVPVLSVHAEAWRILPTQYMCCGGTEDFTL